MQLRSQELTHRLQTIPGFADVRAIKIIVAEAHALPVIPKPRGF